MINVKILFNYITIKTTEYIWYLALVRLKIAREIYWHRYSVSLNTRRSSDSVANVYECRRKARNPSSRRAPLSVAPMTRCSLHPSHRWRKTESRRSSTSKSHLRSFVRSLRTCITMIVRAAKKKSETFETSFSQTSGSDNGMKKTRPVECTACDVEVSKCSTRL